MKIELHMIQNFAPSCLNRDDTNSPKDCIFGGVRRARISSQCIKRAIRTLFRTADLVPPENLAHRTSRLAEEVARRLRNKGRDEDTAKLVAETAIGGLGIGVGEQGRTQYLLFLGESGVCALTELCEANWRELESVAAKVREAREDKEESPKSAKDAKKAAKDAIPKEVQQSLAVVLDGSRAADLALFGRMLADIPSQNIDAACQVAHAISTHKVDMEMDFFTAVDDLKTKEEDAGAGMMGVIGYNSACFYRYAVVDYDQLMENLGKDRELAEKTVEAFLRASAAAIPTGKQNTFAAHNPPDFILAGVRRTGLPLSLANAFVKPARPAGGADLTQASVDMMKDYWDRASAVYRAADGMAGPFYCGLVDPSQDAAGWENVATLDRLVASVMQAVREEA